MIGKTERNGAYMSDIEYFYAAHSGFAYIGSAKLMAIAAASGRRLVHRPIDLNSVIAAARGATFRQRTKAHRDYFFGREIERWSELRDAPVIGHRPTYHDNDVALANCVLIAGTGMGADIDRLAHAFLEAHWRDDADLADAATLANLAAAIHIDPAPLLLKAASDEVRTIYQENTNEAIERSVFGSPTYFVDGDMFYGQDRLEMIEQALEKPFAGQWPRDRTS